MFLTQNNQYMLETKLLKVLKETDDMQRQNLQEAGELNMSTIILSLCFWHNFCFDLTAHTQHLAPKRCEHCLCTLWFLLLFMNFRLESWICGGDCRVGRGIYWALLWSSQSNSQQVLKLSFITSNDNSYFLISQWGEYTGSS